MLIIDHFVSSIRAAARYNTDVQAAPHCILWTDADRQWEVVIPRLQQALPELFVLGDYDPNRKQGPAIWLRGVVAHTLSEVQFPKNLTPILYLPGVSRQDLRAVEGCAPHLKPLAELQYRGVIWSQVNAKDWTILAYLQTAQGGLNLNVNHDQGTKSAIQLALPNLLELDTDRFRGKRLDKDDFYQLISADPTRELLEWLDQGDAFRKTKSGSQWRAFVELCQYQFSFNPEKDGHISGLEKLANHTGIWQTIWQRYCDSYTKFSEIPQRIRTCNPPSQTLDWHDASSQLYSGWPQWNDLQEDKLRSDLLSIDNQMPNAARKIILELEQRHGHRRALIWAEMGNSPLAQTLEPLTLLAKVTADVPLDGGTINDLVAGYKSSGWRADDAVMRALGCVRRSEDVDAVTIAVRSIYLPWAENSARFLQQLIDKSSYPGGNINSAPQVNYNSGTCILFVDGLRFDIAQRLIKELERNDFSVQSSEHWAALPSVTATAKPAVSPVRHQIIGREANVDFEPQVAESEKSLSGGYHFKKLLTDSGWQRLEGVDTGDPSSKGWSEIGAIDTAGHNGDLVYKLDAILKDIKDHVQRLLNAGWKQIDIVTDHGWLFMPGDLPKIDLSKALTENMWGRCAAIKTGASTKDRLFSWFWNPNQHFALADGISCFSKNRTYAHGGLSLQECFTVHFVVTPSNKLSDRASVLITEIDWIGMRCVITAEGSIINYQADIRTEPGDATSSKVVKVKTIKSDGTVSLIVEDEDLKGKNATAVILGENGQLITQKPTVIGGDGK